MRSQAPLLIAALVTLGCTSPTERPAPPGTDLSGALTQQQAPSSALLRLEQLIARHERILEHFGEAGQKHYQGTLTSGAWSHAGGALEGTSRMLDVGIEGPGLLCFRTGGGELLYSRCGALRVDSAGRLCSATGYTLEPELRVPEATVSLGIDQDGVVTATTDASTGRALRQGRIRLHAFRDPGLLSSNDGVCFRRTEAAGPLRVGYPGEQGFGLLHQHFLERSTVRPELERLMLHQLRAKRCRLLGVAGWKRIEELIAIETAINACFAELEAASVPGFKQRRSFETSSDLRDMRSGEIVPTDRCLDLAIDGEGYFALRSTDGNTVFTRNGRLAVDAAGRLCAKNGSVLLPEIRIAEDTISLRVSPTGELEATRASNPDRSERIGQLELTSFGDPSAMRSEDGVSFAAPTPSARYQRALPGSEGLGQLRQRALERSNVDIARAERRIADLRAAARMLRERIDPALLEPAERLYDERLLETALRREVFEGH